MPFHLIAPLGVAAALTAHVLLQAMADNGLGAPEFAAHAHAAFQPALVIEIGLVLWLSALALRDALTIRARHCCAFSLGPRPGTRARGFRHAG